MGDFYGILDGCREGARASVLQPVENSRPRPFAPAFLLAEKKRGRPIGQPL